MTIVGVVKDHKYRSIDEEPIPMAWYEYAQIPMVGTMTVELRVLGQPLSILPAARKALQQLDPNLPLIRPMTQRAQYDTTISQQVLFARLAGFFGLLAVVLVATGLYGTHGLSRQHADSRDWCAHGHRRKAWASGVDGFQGHPAAHGDGSWQWEFRWRCWWDAL